VFDRPTRLVVRAAIVAAVLGVAAGCGGDDDPAEEAGTTQAVTTAPPRDSAQRTVGGGDRSCTDATPDAEREAGSDTACKKVGRAPDQQVAPPAAAGAPPAAAGATSAEKAEIVRQFYDAWNRRDFQAAVRGVDKDFSLRFSGAFANLVGERFDGRDGLLRFMRRFPAAVGGQFAVERTFDMGDRVGVIVTRKAAGSGSGAPLSVRIRQVWTFRDGKVIRVKSSFAGRDGLGVPGSTADR
jgi:ketosteroid isomerase-like protein